VTLDYLTLAPAYDQRREGPIHPARASYR